MNRHSTCTVTNLTGAAATSKCAEEAGKKVVVWLAMPRAGVWAMNELYHAQASVSVVDAHCFSVHLGTQYLRRQLYASEGSYALPLSHVRVQTKNVQVLPLTVWVLSMPVIISCFAVETLNFAAVAVWTIDCPHDDDIRPV